jgi:hypothetical protein
MTMISQAKRIGIVVFTLLLATGGAVVQAEEEEAPEQRMAAKGRLVRLAYNDEGWVTLGYQIANGSVGDEWMLLEMGMTLQQGVKNQTIKREDVTVTTPDGASIPLPTQTEFNKVNLRSLDARANKVHDSINYFPVMTNKACRIGFFTDPGQPGRGPAFETVEVSWDRACLGRIYFHIPDGIQYGQHFLNVQFADSVVKVPFKIVTKEELKEMGDQYKAMKKEAKQKAKEEKKQQ